MGGIEQVTRSFMGAMAWQIYLSVVIFAVGVLSVVVSYLVGHRGRQGASFFWLGLFLTLAGVWGFAGTPIVTLLIKRPLLMHVIVYSCFFASAAPFARLVRTITRDDPSRVMDAMVVLVEGTALVALALQLLGVWQFQQSETAVDVVQAVFYAYVTYRMGARVLRGDRLRGGFAPYYFAGTLLLDVFMALEGINYYYWQALPDMSFLVMGMALFMAVVVAALSLELRLGIRAQAERDRLELRLSEVERRVASEKRWYGNFAASRRELHRQKTELHYQLSTIRAYAEDGDTEGLIQLIDDLDAGIPEEFRARYSDEFAVDAVVGYYVRRAHDAGIDDVEVRLGITEELPASLEEDVCAIVGNLLEHAVEDAVEAAAAGQTPLIHMRSALLRGSILNIVMDSSHAGGAIDVGESVRLRSIESCAQKNGGSARFELAEDGRVLRSSVIMKVRAQ